MTGVWRAAMSVRSYDRRETLTMEEQRIMLMSILYQPSHRVYHIDTSRDLARIRGVIRQ